jgi:biotin-(acetyl-CoA carboxylase) ligase
MLGDGKWSGLIAVRPAERAGELHLGLGANLVAAPPSVTDPPAAALKSWWPAWPGDEAVAGMLLSAALEVLRRGRASMRALLVDWARFDALTPGEPVVIASAGRRLEGRYRGVDPDGRLVVEGHGGELRFSSGDVTRLRGLGGRRFPSALPRETG